MKKTNLDIDQPSLKLWFLIHRTRDVFANCEDKIFGKYGLTTEQFSVLVTMKYLGDSVRVTDLARGLERSTNSVSMIVDRMTKIGLVRRIRDKTDRRVVRVVMTEKGAKAVKPATVVGLEFIQKAVSPLSAEDRRTLINLLEKVKYEALKQLSPKIDIEEVRRNDITNQPDLVKRVRQYVSAPGEEAKSRAGQKRTRK